MLFRIMCSTRLQIERRHRRLVMNIMVRVGTLSKHQRLQKVRLRTKVGNTQSVGHKVGGNKNDYCNSSNSTYLHLCGLRAWSNDYFPDVYERYNEGVVGRIPRTH